jgi:hypothetical protein
VYDLVQGALTEEAIVHLAVLGRVDPDKFLLAIVFIYRLQNDISKLEVAGLLQDMR